MTSPADLSTFRCCETAGRLTGSSRASSPTALGDFASRSKIARRVGSASAVNIAAWLVMTYGKLQLTDAAVKPRRVRGTVKRAIRVGRSAPRGARRCKGRHLGSYADDLPTDHASRCRRTSRARPREPGFPGSVGAAPG